MIPALNTPMVVLVGSITKNADKFNGSSGVKYCHYCSLILADETVVKGQICTDVPEMNWFEENDKITVTLTNNNSSKTQAPYTFKFQGIENTAATLANKPTISPALKNNPLVSGTLRDRALTHAINLYAARVAIKPTAAQVKADPYLGDIGANVVVNMARVFEAYLKEDLI